mgnify:CR=1 FL=1|jgi:hypothetical protein
MTNTELLNIHLNNSDLNLTNLSNINNSSVAVVRSILVEYYKTKGYPHTNSSWIHPIFKESKVL